MGRPGSNDVFGTAAVEEVSQGGGDAPLTGPASAAKSRSVTLSCSQLKPRRKVCRPLHTKRHPESDTGIRGVLAGRRTAPVRRSAHGREGIAGKRHKRRQGGERAGRVPGSEHRAIEDRRTFELIDRVRGKVWVSGGLTVHLRLVALFVKRRAERTGERRAAVRCRATPGRKRDPWLRNRYPRGPTTDTRG